MTQNEIKALEAELEALNHQEADLSNELDSIKSNNFKNLTKEELKREVTIRRELDRINSRRAEINQVLASVRNNGNGNFFTKLAIIGLVAILAFAGYNYVKKNGLPNCAPKNSDRSISISDVATPKATAVPTPTPLLTDPSDNRQVAKAASAIYGENVRPMLEATNNMAMVDFFSPEAIEDIIRVYNAELPMYSNYDEYTIAETVNLANDIFANQGNKNNLYPMDFSKLYPTGSNEAKYIQTYDDIYRKIAQYRATGNVDGFVEQCKELTYKVYKEWHLAGLYGGYNPYLFPAEEHYFLLQAATSRFSNYVREYLESNDLTICINACYDLDKENYRDVEIRDIFEALYMGTSKNGQISVLRSGEVVNLFGETFADAKNYLNARANVKVKGLN